MPGAASGFGTGTGLARRRAPGGMRAPGRTEKGVPARLDSRPIPSQPSPSHLGLGADRPDGHDHGRIESGPRTPTGRIIAPRLIGIASTIKGQDGGLRVGSVVLRPVPAVPRHAGGDQGLPARNCRAATRPTLRDWAFTSSRKPTSASLRSCCHTSTPLAPPWQSVSNVIWPGRTRKTCTWRRDGCPNCSCPSTRNRPGGPTGPTCPAASLAARTT